MLLKTSTLLFGLGGAGKTITAALLGAALSKERHNGAGVTLMDTEEVAEFVTPIFAAEGVPLFIEPSRSFVDMREALPRAVERGCCAFIVDHYDGVHRELSEAQTLALGMTGRQRPYHHREDLIRLWEAWVMQYRTTPIHMILTARQANLWGDDETPEGDPFKVKLGTKARGDADANYEPNLLIEMEKIERFTREKGSKRKIGQIEHAARVVKDRRMVLEGLSWVWPNMNGYKSGGYKGVWKSLAPHFTADPRVGPGGILRPEATPRDSQRLFNPQSGESKMAERARRITIAVEEIQAALNAIWPGQGADEKRLRVLVMEALFQTRSWTAVETFAPERVESAWKIMQHFEADCLDIAVKDDDAVIKLLNSCKELEAERQENVGAL